MVGSDENKGMAVSVRVICCRVLEQEIRTVVGNVPEVTHVDVMELDLHIQPDFLLETLSQRIRTIHRHVDAVMVATAAARPYTGCPMILPFRCSIRR